MENLFDVLLGNPEVLTGSGGLSFQHTFLDDTRLLRDAVAQLISGVFAGIFDAPTTVAIDWNAPIQSLSLSRLMPLGDDAVGMFAPAHGVGHASEPQRRRLAVEPERFVGREPAAVEDPCAERVEAEGHR